MAIDIETGEVGNVAELLVKANARRQKRWADHLMAGRQRVRTWQFMNGGRRVSPTRFYKLMHEV